MCKCYRTKLLHRKSNENVLTPFPTHMKAYINVFIGEFFLVKVSTCSMRMNERKRRMSGCSSSSSFIVVERNICKLISSGFRMKTLPSIHLKLNGVSSSSLPFGLGLSSTFTMSVSLSMPLRMPTKGKRWRKSQSSQGPA